MPSNPKTIVPPSSEIIEQICSLIEDRFGLYFVNKTWSEVETRLMPMVKALGYVDPSSCFKDLLSSSLDQVQLEKLAETLTIGETYFFRNPETFNSLKKKVLPTLISEAKDRRLRIWSAACATGEEPYTLAILLYQLLLGNFSGWDIKIEATDINLNFLKIARRGVYKKWSFRVLDEEIKKQFFREIPSGEFAIIPEVKRLVDFSCYNLVKIDNKVKKEFDLILCNNVLIYFSPLRIGHIVENLVDALRDLGWLMVTPIEVPYIKNSRLKSIAFENSLFFQKQPITKQLPPPFELTFSPSERQKVFPQVIPKNNQLSTDFYHSLFESKKYEELIAGLEKEFKNKKNSQEVKKVELLIRAYANQGKSREAKAWCQKALEWEKVDPLLYCLYATILEEGGEWDEAKKALKKALFLDHHLVVAYFILGNLELKQNKVKEALKLFRNASQLLEEKEDSEILPGTDGMQKKEMKEIIAKIVEPYSLE